MVSFFHVMMITVYAIKYFHRKLTVTDWPSQNPDLTFTEAVWDHLDKYIKYSLNLNLNLSSNPLVRHTRRLFKKKIRRISPSHFVLFLCECVCLVFAVCILTKRPENKYGSSSKLAKTNKTRRGLRLAQYIAHALFSLYYQ